MLRKDARDIGHHKTLDKRFHKVKAPFDTCQREEGEVGEGGIRDHSCPNAEAHARRIAFYKEF